MSAAPRLPANSASAHLLSGVRKAAIFLVAVGDELGKKILQNLSEPDVQRLTEELADLRGVPPELSLEVIEEFHEMLDSQESSTTASAGAASRKASVSAPPVASRTCQRKSARASRTRWRNEASALTRTAVRAVAEGPVCAVVPINSSSCSVHCGWRMDWIRPACQSCSRLLEPCR